MIAESSTEETNLTEVITEENSDKDLNTVPPSNLCIYGQDTDKDQGNKQDDESHPLEMGENLATSAEGRVKERYVGSMI